MRKATVISVSLTPRNHLATMICRCVCGGWEGMVRRCLSEIYFYKTLLYSSHNRYLFCTGRESVFGSAGFRAHHNSLSLIQHYSQERRLLILYSRRQEGLIAHQAKLDILSTTGDFCSFFSSSVFLSKHFVSFERSRGWKGNKT